MSFLEREKSRYAAERSTATWLSDAARADGEYRGLPRPFCMPVDAAAENLFEGIREKVVRYFADHRVRWHDATPAGPSNHLCSSMVCGLNFLAPLTDKPDAATAFLRHVFGEDDLIAVPVVDDRLVEFEWVGNPEIDYLGEGMNRTRGANATSADAAMAYTQGDGTKTLVLIEWKYTEAYATEDKGQGQAGETRKARYQALFEQPDSPFDTSRVAYEETLFEPFYQLMRQQLLAWRMQAGGAEVGAHRVRVLHLSPRANTDFERVTSPALADRHPGMKVTELWTGLLREPESFAGLAVEEAFAPLLSGAEELGLAAWRSYVVQRYPWVLGVRADTGD